MLLHCVVLFILAVKHLFAKKKEKKNIIILNLYIFIFINEYLNTSMYIHALTPN